MTYDELVARMIAATAIDVASDDTWAGYLPAIVEQAELRCYRDVDFLATRATASVTLAPGVAQFSAPADWLLGQGISLVIAGARIALDRRDDGYLREYAGTSTGIPRYWAEPTAGTLLLAPSPDVTYAAELLYHLRPAALSATMQTSVLSLAAPDLLFYAVMVALQGYLKNFSAQSDDAKAAMSWNGMYAAVLPSVQREEGRRKGDGGFDTSAAPPPSLNAPAGGKG